MVTQNRKTMDEAEIRALLENRVNAIRARDVKGVMAHIAPDVLSFDVVNPLHYVGVNASRSRTEEWFALYQGPIGFEIWDLSIMAGGDVAFSHSFNRVTGTTTAGKEIDMYWRATVCYQKITGRWLITHEHNSVPFNPTNGQASLDLKP